MIRKTRWYTTHQRLVLIQHDHEFGQSSVLPCIFSSLSRLRLRVPTPWCCSCSSCCWCSRRRRASNWLLGMTDVRIERIGYWSRLVGHCEISSMDSKAASRCEREANKHVRSGERKGKQNQITTRNKFVFFRLLLFNHLTHQVSFDFLFSSITWCLRHLALRKQKVVLACVCTAENYLSYLRAFGLRFLWSSSFFFFFAVFWDCKLIFCLIPRLGSWEGLLQVERVGRIRMQTISEYNQLDVFFMVFRLMSLSFACFDFQSALPIPMKMIFTPRNKKRLMFMALLLCSLYSKSEVY